MGRATGYDYVIVGAGSAGCVLARRLGEDDAVRILVLEAGGPDRDKWIHLPLGWGRILQHRLHDWGYDTEPEPHLDGRVIGCMRGKVIGGSSSINAMTCVRGHPADYDRWAAAGLDGWSYADALPYFRKQERWEEGANDYRGGDGPLYARRGRYADPLIDAWIAAGGAAGHPFTDDYNGAEQHGFARIQSWILDGRRVSGARAYLRPAMTRPNVRVATGAHATRVLVERGRAVGVEYVQGGRTLVARADREVLLAGGTYNSPQLLMLSGIGDPAALAAHGIGVREALPGVGRNLQDHVSAVVSWRRRGPGLLHRNLRADRIALAVVQGRLFGTGFTTELPSGLVAFLKTDTALPVPDMQVLFNAGPLGATPWLRPFRAPFEDGFACRAVLLRPESRGSVDLVAADPLRAPRIRQNFLATDADRRTLRAAVRVVREVGRQRALGSSFVAAELLPGPDVSSDADVDAHVRATAVTVHHPVGTCRMGRADDPLAVVDPSLRVRGVDALRVIDASVMPDLVGGNINATVVMIAERAADLIRGRTPLAPDVRVAARRRRAAAAR